MKFLIPALAAVFFLGQASAQVLFTEDFETYNGFGSSLNTNWPTTNFKVYINHGTDGSKGCGSLFNNLHRIDSLVSPDLGSVTGGVQLNFDARLGTDIVGATPTAGYIPGTNDHIWFLSSFDGGPYQLVQELTPQFTNTSAAFTSFSIPVQGSSSTSLRLKMKVNKAQTPSNSEFYLDFDNFAVSLLTANRHALQGDHAIQIVPNPTPGIAQINLGEGWGPKTMVEVYNILGTKIGEMLPVNGKINLDLNGQKPGIYLIKVSEGGYVQVKRVVLR